MRLRFRPIAAALIAALVLAIAPAAHAAYAPKLAVTVKPSTTKAPIELISTVTQDASEEANKKVVVHFPVGLTFDLFQLPKFSNCTEQQATSKACPDASQIGTAHATVVGLAAFDGKVYLGDATSGSPLIWVILSNGIAPLDQVIKGVTVFRPDGGLDNIFDNLPNSTTTSFILDIQGPPQYLLENPDACGTFNFVGEFTSQNGSKATSTSPINVDGCPPPPTKLTLTGLRVAPANASAKKGATLSFKLSKAARVRVAVHKKGSSRVLQRASFSGKAGANKVTGIGKRLKPGSYLVDVRAGSIKRSAGLKIKR